MVKMLSHHSTQKQLESVFLSASSKMLRTKNTNHGYTMSRFCSKRNKPATTLQCHSVLKRRKINSFPLSIPSNHILSVMVIFLIVSNNVSGFHVEELKSCQAFFFPLEKCANMATGQELGNVIRCFHKRRNGPSTNTTQLLYLKKINLLFSSESNCLIFITETLSWDTRVDPGIV